MPSVAEIVSDLEVSESGIPYVFFGASKPKSLVVCFAAMGTGGYSRIRWFWRDDGKYRDAYLFLVDKSNLYYLAGREEIYRSIIMEHVNSLGLKPKDVVCVGNSMAAYASIYYATTLGLKAAAVSNPQTTIEAAKASPHAWSRKMAQAGAPDLDTVVSQAGSLPFIHLTYGLEGPDAAAAEALLAALKTRSARFEVERDFSGKHHGSLPSKETIEAVCRSGSPAAFLARLSRRVTRAAF